MMTVSAITDQEPMLLEGQCMIRKKTKMPELMWTIWIVGTVLSLMTIYVLLRVLYLQTKSLIRINHSYE